MSEPLTISPLLDGFTIGNVMSEHDGVQCCPAIKENSDKKYIIKIISVPASQKQMDALLLAGAYRDPADAMDYYNRQAEDICKEAELLQTLSQKEGFLPYDGWQIEPITKRRLGYQVYLLSSYKRSLEKHLHRNPVTHLEAFNMAIDICEALALCRQAGSLYVDLKPTNIFMSEQKEYRIGDLGFLSLDALSYTTLPDKYHSAYTPPEFEDPMAPLNTTADTYALGMILYQLYNDSRLPAPEDLLNGEAPTPVNADYELAEIIMTAIHPDPALRWQTPDAMRQALVSYMQRNAVNDVPITSHTPLDTAAAETASDEKESDTSDPIQEESTEPEQTEDRSPDEVVSAEDATPETARDDSAPSEEDADLLQPHEMSEELSRMVAKADDLIAHETPEGVVIPEVPDPFAFASEDSEEIDDSDIPLDPIMEEETEPASKPEKKKKKSHRFVSPERKRRIRRFFTTILFLAAAAAVGLCGYLYYQLFYLIPVNSLTIQGDESNLIVTIDTTAEESKIRVLCSDDFGHTQSASVKNHTASFEDLSPYTQYTIKLEYDGFHKLSGENTAVFTTDANTNIVSFTSSNGPEDGSFVLNFTVDGAEPKKWTVICTTEGEDIRHESFTGHSVTIKGLTVGKIYTFTLMTEDDLTLSGMTSIERMASRIILAEDLTVTSENGSDMTLHWRTSGDVVVDSWDVRCYNNQGFDAQFTVDETKALIPGVDLSAGYTIEITASGMTEPARFSITKEPIVINSFTVENDQDSTKDHLQLNWEFTGDTPKDGWLLMYTVDGAMTPTVIRCAEPSAVISPKIPGGHYRFTLHSANGTSVINNTLSCECPEAEKFDNFGLTSEQVSARLLVTPELQNWRFESVSEDDFTDTYAVGDPISIVLQSDSGFYLPGNEVRILYLYTDAFGNAIADLVHQEKMYWKNIWSGGDAKTGELDVPIAPDAPGNYLLNIFIDNKAVAQAPLTIQ